MTNQHTTASEVKIKLLNAAMVCIIFLFLEYYYINILTTRYSSGGYTFTFNIIKYIETKCLFSFLLLFMHFRKISDFIYGITYLFLIFFFIPNLIIYEFMNVPHVIIYAILFIQILIISMGLRKYSISFPPLDVKKQVTIIVLVALLMMVPVFLDYGLNLNFNVLLLQGIYEVRAENAGKESLLTSYFYPWLSKIIFPVILVYGLLLKRYSLVLFSLGGLLYLFLVGAHKSVFFTIFPVIFFFFYRNYPLKIYYLMLFLTSAFLLSLFLANGFDYLMAESIVVRRTFFDPAISNHFYFDFFHEKPLLLSHSIMKHFLDYPFENQPERIISTIYFHSPDGNANNGIISDGFMNFGTIGVFVYGFFVALIIKIFDSFEIHDAFFGIFMVIVFTFISSFFLSTLLTHGVLLFLILSVLFLKTSAVLPVADKAKL